MKNRSINNGLILVLTAIVLASCGKPSAQMGRRPGQGVTPVPVITLQPRSITLTSSYPTTLEGAQTIQIRPRVPGFITTIPVNEGDAVSKGEVLFTINNKEYKQQVRTAEVKVKQAKNNLQQLKPLVEQNIVSDYQLQEAKLNLEAAQAALTNAKVNLSYTIIKSPISGVIGRIPYDVGALVNATIQMPLTTVSTLSPIYAYFSMSERELLEMALNVASEGGNKTLGQLVSDMPDVKLELANGKIYNEEGTLKLASGIINTQTGSAQFRAAFTNPQQILRSGGTGSILVPVSMDSAIVIPKSATFEVQEKRFVYTVTDSNTVKNTMIETFPLSTEKLFVVTKGLSSGSVIVNMGMGLRPNSKVKPQPVNTDSLYRALSGGSERGAQH